MNRVSANPGTGQIAVIYSHPLYQRLYRQSVPIVLETHLRNTGTRLADDHTDVEVLVRKRLKAQGITPELCNEAEEIGGGGFGKVYRIPKPAEMVRFKGKSVIVKVASEDSRSQEFLAEEGKHLARIAGSRDKRAAEYFLKSYYDPELKLLFMEETPDAKTLREVTENIRRNVMPNHDPTSERYSLTSDLVAQLYDAIDFLHTAGILHGDMKPENILVHWPKEANGKPRIKIIDLGIAVRNSSPHDGNVTGTPNYVSPNLMSGIRTGNVDLHSISKVALETLGFPLRPEQPYTYVRRYSLLEGPVDSLDYKWSPEAILRKSGDATLAKIFEPYQPIGWAVWYSRFSSNANLSRKLLGSALVATRSGNRNKFSAEFEGALRQLNNEQLFHFLFTSDYPLAGLNLSNARWNAILDAGSQETLADGMRAKDLYLERLEPLAKRLRHQGILHLYETAP